MVAEEVPAMLVPAPGGGVKRSREQTNQPTAAPAQVRPALDADPAEHRKGRTMDSEGRATTSTAIRSRSQHSLTARRPSLLPAVSSGQTSEPACGHDALTRGMFQDASPAGFGDGS